MNLESPKLLWTGRILSTLAVLPFLVGAAFTLKMPDKVAEGMAHYGFPAGFVHTIVGLELLCGLLYAIPATSVLGAILLTGYLGGAVVTHLRVGEPAYIPVIVGVIVWLGLYLRDPRLRQLVPFRR
jgi:hypothetical protein